LKSDWKLPLYKIYSDDEDVDLITKIIRRGKQWAIGPEIEEFEKNLADYVDTEYCVTLNSGTSALHSTFLAYGLTKGDDVIVPSFSFISTANSVQFVGSNPIFADIEEETYGLDPSSILNNLTSTTKAIMPMDYGGMSCNIFDIKAIAEEHDLILIEDAAEGLGSSIKGKKTGSLADSAIFSFCGNKVLTTGEGGAVVTDSKEIYEKIKLIRSHGRLDSISYFDNPNSNNYNILGYNWRMSSLTAALGISQLQKLDKIIKMRQDNAKYICNGLSKCSEIKLPIPTKDYEHIYQMFSIRVKNQKIRDNLHNYLLNMKIFSKVYFQPIHLLPFYKNTLNITPGSLPLTEKIANEILTIPLYPNMTTEEKDYLINSILHFFESIID
jgi:perosamine synthetase